MLNKVVNKVLDQVKAIAKNIAKIEGDIDLSKTRIADYKT